MERSPAPSMSNSMSTAPHDDPSPVPPETEPQLFFSQKNIFSATRQLRPNETLPPLSQPKRAFGRIVPLARNAATGTGKGYRSHVPLTMHVRINDTDGRAMSSLLDTGASLSCIDADLLRRMGGQPTGTPMKVHGIGAATTLGWVTLPLFIQAQDPHGQHAHLELEQDFHVLPSFAPGMCLGLDFIDAHGVGISPVRGRGRIGTFTFQVHERLAGPFASEAELCVTHDVDLPAGTQAWVPVNASCLAPDVDYTVGPRMCVSPDETVRLAGPVGVLTHASERHILVGNHGVAPFILPRGTVIADAVAARVGDTVSSAAEAFTLCPLTPRHEAAVGFSLAVDETDPALPIDAFADEAAATPSLAQDVATTLVDDVFRVGIGEHGTADDDLVALLRRHKAAFALDGRPGRIVGHDMGIQLQPGAVLQSEAPRRTSPEKRTAMDAAIQQLLDWDVIEPSASPVSFPVVMVRQQGKWRLCVDYRKRNADTIPDRYPLPTIDSIFQTLCGKKVFSSLDAIRGYHQLGVKEDDRWKTAFVCHKGLFQYKTVPFGLRNAPAVFQRLMDKVLGPLRWNQAVVYIDDAVVATDTMAEHIQALDTLLQSATDVGLKFSPAKCTFGVPSLTLLGRKVSGAGVAIWEDRAQAIATLARPTTLQEMYHTLGLFGYYRAFVPNFAIRAAPLTRLLKGWRYESADGHTRLVNTEGKAVAAGRVPIAWGPEQQDSFEGLRHAIANPPVLAHPDPSRPYLLYTDASKHALAAILHQVSSSSASVPASNPHAKLNTLTIPQLPSPFARQRWRSWLEEDRYFAPLLRQARDTPTASDEWVIQDEILVRRVDDRVALPLAALPVVLKAVHDDGGHFGFTKTLLAVRNHFWRPHLATSVRAWVKHCTECQRIKTAPKTGVLDVSKDASLPFEAVSFDLIYGFPRSRSGNDAALVMQDLFSRMILLEPCHKEITAEGVAAIVSNRILRFGWRPKRLVSDSEARVSGSVLSALAASLGAVPTPSSPYHQQANSVERAVQIVQQVLQVLSLDSKAHWDRRLLPSVELAMNSSPSTVTGHRPFDLVFLSHPSVVHAVFDADEHLGVSSFEERLAAGHERLDTAQRQISVARLDQKRRFDSRRARPPLISAGMRAWIRLRDRPIAGAIGDKLDVRKLGPFEVEEVLSPHRVRLCLPPHLDIDPVLNIEQLDFAPSDMDPFAAHRPSSAVVEAGSPELRVDGGSQELRADGSLQGDISGGVGELSSSRSGEDRYSSVAIDAAALPPRRVRHLPESMRDFHVGTVQPAPSPELLDLLRGPLPRPRSFQEGNDLLVLSERPVAFISRLTSPAEEKLVAAELELVCLAWAFHKLAHLLEGASLTVITDHAPMERMLRSTNSITYGPTVTRCRALIMPHLGNIRFIYRPGPRHTNADALSRLIPDQGRSASGGGDVLASQTIIDE
ncbi:hypothetical protein CF335_g7597 [Tilletia laevis]|nr:hypothetical protein CF335_g7597 [Tilletia laevis]